MVAGDDKVAAVQLVVRDDEFLMYCLSSKTTAFVVICMFGLLVWWYNSDESDVMWFGIGFDLLDAE